METRRTIVAVLAALTVFYLSLFVYNRIWPPPPRPATQPAPASLAEAEPAGTPSTAPTTTRPVGGQPAPGPQPKAVTATAPALATGLRVENASDLSPVVLGSTAPDSPFPMSLEITPRGATVERAFLRDYHQTVKREKPYQILQPALPDSDSAESAPHHSFLTSAIRFVDLQQEVNLENVVWQREAADEQHVVYAVTVQDPAGQPVARVVKSYTLLPQPADRPISERTYDLGLNLAVENLSGQPLRIVLLQQGPIGFTQEQTRGEDRKVLGAVWERDQTDGPTVKGHYRADVLKRKILPLGADEEGRRIAWVAEANQYFACIMAPAGRLGPDDAPRFERAEAVHYSELKEGYGQDLTFRFVTSTIDLPPDGRKEVAFDCYLGPKSKRILQSVERYQKRDYYAVITESFYMCAPVGLTSFMMWLLDTFHRIPPHNYGVAIIILVLVVRTILHPITKKSQVNMTRMQKQMSALQPKLAAAKEKYGNDRQAFSQAQMEIYREAGINPAANMLSCLPMMLQIPIWGALYAALASTIEMRHAPFDPWLIRDLARPDALIDFGRDIHIPLLSFLMGGPIRSLNLLPILLGVSQILQSKFMPRGNTSVQTKNAPDQLEQQRKMMMFMSVFFVFLFYNMPSGLNLYIMSSNLFGMLEQWRIRKHVDELEEKQKSQPTDPNKSRQKSWLHRKWEQLQKEAEEARQIQGTRKKEKDKAGSRSRR